MFDSICIFIGKLIIGLWNCIVRTIQQAELGVLSIRLFFLMNKVLKSNGWNYKEIKESIWEYTSTIYCALYDRGGMGYILNYSIWEYLILDGLPLEEFLNDKLNS